MPVFNNAFEKFIIGEMNLAPAPMFDLLGGFSFYAVASAKELNLFDELERGPLAAGELASRTQSDVRGLGVLLELLETLGYVKLTKRGYALTPVSRKWMLASSAVDFSEGFVYYHRTMMELWPFIAGSVRKGDAHINFYEWLGKHPDTAASYQKFMMSLASMVIPGLVRKLKFRNESVLDIGGSHGLYSIALCRNNPDIHVTIIDSEYAMPLLKKNISGAGLEHRITLLTGNFMDYALHEKFDTILLFNVIHEHREEYNIQLLGRIRDTLNSNGSLVILDGMKEKKVSGLMELAERMYSLLFFHFLGGRNYSYDEIRSWLEGAGFTAVKRTDLRVSGFTMIRAGRYR
jgi:SAM-dependent methyltransferase